MSEGHGDLRRKIDEARRRLPLLELLARLGLGAHAKKCACCPLPGHDDKHPSFSVFKGRDGFWHYNCFVCDMQGGDEIAFLAKHFNISRREAIKRYLDMTGFPAKRPPKSREGPSVSSVSKSRGSLSILVSESPESHVYPESPVSNGQGLDGEKEKVLRAFAARNACTEPNTARKRRFKLVRDLRAIEKGIGRELETRQLTVAFNEWHWLSQGFLDSGQTREDHFGMFLAELTKVRVPTGEGDTLKKALECVSKLPASELPVIPGYPGAPEAWRRLTALHRELSRLCANKKYFLSYRDAAKAYAGLSHQRAYDITLALDRLGVIKILRRGKAGLNSGKAAEFRYLLSQSENGAEEDDAGFDL